MNHAEIVNELEALGLDEDEASVYLRLLQVGPAKVSQLADYVDLSRSSLYRVLDGLVEEGFVSKSLDRPTVYTPEEPQRIFELGSQELRQQLDRLERVQSRVLGRLQEIAGDDGMQEDAHHWKRLEGASQIYEIIAKRAREATESIDLISNHGLCMETDRAAVDRAWRALAERGRDGVDLRMLIGFDEPKAAVPDPVLKASREVRIFDQAETLHFLLFDRRELVLVLRAEEDGAREDEMAVWTNAPGILATHESLVDSLWPQADPLA